MSKLVVDQFIFKLFIIMLAFDVVSVVYLTPKVEQPVKQPEQEKTNSTQEEEQQDKQNKSSNDNQEGNEEEDVFKSEKSDDDLTGTLVIQHCSSHQTELESIKTYVNAQYPTVVFESSIYPLSPVKEILSKFLQYIHWIMLALNLFGDKIFGFLQMPYPQWYILMKEKKMIVLGVVLVGSMFLSGIVNKTHAFEVYFNGDLAHSKLQTGFIPTVDQVVAIIQSAQR